MKTEVRNMAGAVAIERCRQRLLEALAACALVGSWLHVPGVHGAVMLERLARIGEREREKEKEPVGMHSQQQPRVHVGKEAMDMDLPSRASNLCSRYLCHC